jgi:hypothetical protein
METVKGDLEKQLEQYVTMAEKASNNNRFNFGYSLESIVRDKNSCLRFLELGDNRMALSKAASVASQSLKLVIESVESTDESWFSYEIKKAAINAAFQEAKRQFRSWLE